MKTIRQLLCVRSLVLAIAFASLMLLWPMTTPASAQTSYTINAASRIVELKLGTDASGNPAVLATMHGSFWTTFPVGCPTSVVAELHVDSTTVLSVRLPVNSRDSGMPDILTVTWAYPLSLMSRGPHGVGFAGIPEIPGTSAPGSAGWGQSITVTVP